MNCRQFTREISRHADRELTDSDVEDLRRHVQECSGCRSFHEVTVAAGSELRRRRRIIPPSDLVDEVLALTVDRKQPRRKPLLSLWVQVPVGAALIVVALGLGSLQGARLGQLLVGGAPEPSVMFVSAQGDYSVEDIILSVDNDEGAR